MFLEMLFVTRVTHDTSMAPIADPWHAYSRQPAYTASEKVQKAKTRKQDGT